MATRIRGRHRPVELAMIACNSALVGATARGSGVHRRFKREEVIVACIVAPFAKQKMAIGALQSVGHAVRQYLRTGKQYPNLDVRNNDYLLVCWAEGKSAELVIEHFDLMSDERSHERDFFVILNRHKPAKMDVINLKEVLRDLPAKP
jgi:hypothetical protein